MTTILGRAGAGATQMPERLAMTVPVTHHRQTVALASATIAVETMSAKITPSEIALSDPPPVAVAFPRPGRAAAASPAIMPVAIGSVVIIPAAIILVGPPGGAAPAPAGLAAVTAAEHLNY